MTGQNAVLEAKNARGEMVRYTWNDLSAEKMENITQMNGQEMSQYFMNLLCSATSKCKVEQTDYFYFI